MSLEVRQASGVAKAQRLEVRDSGGIKVAKIAQVRDASGTAKTFWQQMSSLASPGYISGAVNVAGTTTVTTGATTATPTGGTGPYTYLWAISGAGWSLTAPTSPSTAASRSGLGPDDDDTTTIFCTITDSSGITAISNSVTAYCQNVSYL